MAAEDATSSRHLGDLEQHNSVSLTCIDMNLAAISLV